MSNCISHLHLLLYPNSICLSQPLCCPVTQWWIYYLYLYDRNLLHNITAFKLGCTLTSGAALSLHQPVQTYRYTLLPCPIVIQMLGWWLKCLSLLIGVCKGITAEGEPCHTNFDMENHICELPNNIIYRELSIPGKTFFLQPLHLLSWISSMLILFFLDPQRLREQGGWGRLTGGSK